MTSAPRSARIMVLYGPASTQVKSSTRMPESGPSIATSLTFTALRRHQRSFGLALTGAAGDGARGPAPAPPGHHVGAADRGVEPGPGFQRQPLSLGLSSGFFFSGQFFACHGHSRFASYRVPLQDAQWYAALSYLALRTAGRQPGRVRHGGAA